MKNCLKCGYQRVPTDTGPDFSCPKCGAVYAKVESALAEKVRQKLAKETAITPSGTITTNEEDAVSSVLTSLPMTATSQPTKGKNEKFCGECAAVINAKAEICPKCGVRQMAMPGATKDGGVDTLDTPTGKSAPKKKSSGLLKGILYLVGIGLLSSFVLPMMDKRESPPAKSSASAAPAPAPNPNISSDDVCRNDGDAIATVYFANIKKAVEVGMVASEMMTQGCQQKAGGRGNECVKLCEVGFKFRAKQWVKN